VARIIKGYVDTSGGQIHYRMTTPRSDGLPLVLFHQIASSSAMYEALMAELGDDFWMFAPDVPGFGKSFSPPAGPSVEHYARVLHESLQAMGITECWMFGHHFGATLAVQMSHVHPHFARKLVLSGPPYLSPEATAALANDIYVQPMLMQADGGHLIHAWKRILSRDSTAPLALSHREAVLTLQAERFHEAYQSAFEYDFARTLSTIECTVLLMAGEFDTLHSALEPASAVVKRCIVRVVPKGTNYMCDLEPEAVADILREFFLGYE